MAVHDELTDHASASSGYNSVYSLSKKGSLDNLGKGVISRIGTLESARVEMFLGLQKEMVSLIFLWIVILLIKSLIIL